MSEKPTREIPTADAEIVITRHFDAPRALVFEAWTRADRFARWFGPRELEVRVVELDPRPGGVLHFGHRFPDGRMLWVLGRFLEVEADVRLVFTSAFVDEATRPSAHPMFPDWPLEAVLTTLVTFEDEGRGTTLTIRQRIAPASVLESDAVRRERPLAREGWSETLDRLAELYAPS